MNSFIRISKKISFVLTALLAGVCLFIIFTAFNANRTVLNSSYHKQLFEKHDIYTKTHTVISSSISQYVESLKKASPEDFEQHKEIFLLLQKSITPEMVRANLDSIRDGLFQYFRGEQKFLPDIYLNPANDKSIQSPGEESSGNSSIQNSPYQALYKIEKINLSAILLYVNRSDISDSLFEIKFIDYMISQAPGLLILVLLLLAVIGLYLCRKPVNALKWLAAFALAGGAASIISGISLLLYSYYILPKNIYPLIISLPLEREVILSYLHDCIRPLYVSLSVFGIFLIILSTAIFYLPAFVPALSGKKQSAAVEKKHPSKNMKIAKNIIFIFFCLLLLSALFYKLDALKTGFEANDFKTAIAKMKNANTVTQVISAKNEAIYTLHVKLVDGKDSTPIKAAGIIVDGKSVLQDSYFNQSASTDDTGTAKFTLDKGAFRIGFDSKTFPKQYQIPAAFYCDLKAAGTTIITVNLEESDKSEEEAYGIAEIEILDSENKPVSGMELTVEGLVSTPGLPDDIFSVSNSEGIAVFKITPGTYKINFTDEKFPDSYIKPEPIEAYISAQSVTRYTIRLVDAGDQKDH